MLAGPLRRAGPFPAAAAPGRARSQSGPCEPARTGNRSSLERRPTPHPQAPRPRGRGPPRKRAPARGREQRQGRERRQLRRATDGDFLESALRRARRGRLPRAPGDRAPGSGPALAPRLRRCPARRPAARPGPTRPASPRSPTTAARAGAGRRRGRRRPPPRRTRWRSASVPTRTGESGIGMPPEAPAPVASPTSVPSDAAAPPAS